MAPLLAVISGETPQGALRGASERPVEYWSPRVVASLPFPTQELGLASLVTSLNIIGSPMPWWHVGNDGNRNSRCQESEARRLPGRCLAHGQLFLFQPIAGHSKTRQDLSHRTIAASVGGIWLAATVVTSPVPSPTEVNVSCRWHRVFSCSAPRPYEGRCAVGGLGHVRVASLCLPRV